MKKITTPLTQEKVLDLHAGDSVLISGIMYTGRDLAHKRLFESVQKGESTPFVLKDQIIYYVGPAPAKPGYAIGPAGPTTSYRMDPYAPLLLEHGLRGMIGKGNRGEEVKKAIEKYKGVYFAAIGGAAALISKRVMSSEIIAYEDLGTEAVRRLEVEDFPVIVVNDAYGRDYYEEGVANYRR